jgi:hypothetical protein
MVGLRRAASDVFFLWSFHISLVIVLAVKMRDSALLNSKVFGKGGKQHDRFPGFPSTIISTVQFHCALRFMPIFYLLELGAFGLLYPLCGLGVAAGCGRAFERADRES